MERTITCAESIYEAVDLEMSRDPNVIVMGQGIDDFKGCYGTTKDLHLKYGKDRAFDTPLSEDGMTGIAIGAAFAGLRPIHMHIRMDFMLLAMNQLINIAAKAHYMFGGQVCVPLVVRGIIGRSWGQGAQHSQGIYPMLMHTPGLKVVAPTTPYDTKGAMIQAIRDDNPVIFVEHRMVHFQRGHAPMDAYTIPEGKMRILTEGEHITILGVSHMAVECQRAGHLLAEKGIRAEVIDPVWLSPLDLKGIAASVAKTGHLLVVDCDWSMCGAGAEIVASVVERLQDDHRIKVKRMGFAPVTCPTTKNLENLFYPNPKTIAQTAHGMLKGGDWEPEWGEAPEIVEFKGPF